MIVCTATHKTKLMYFFLVQTDQGDVFKVTLESEHDIVRFLFHFVLKYRFAPSLFGFC